MKLGLVGLPYVGKTTLFNALTGAAEQTGTFVGRGATHLRVVQVPDARLAWLRDRYQPKKYTPATVQYADFAGVNSADRDAGFFVACREVDAIVHVLRAFQDPGIPHIKDRIDPAADLEDVITEFVLSDLEIASGRIDRLEKGLKRPGATKKEDEAELAALRPIAAALEQGRPAAMVQLSPEDAKRIRGFQLLTCKPFLVVLNGAEPHDPHEPAETQLGALPGFASATLSPFAAAPALHIAAQLESEIAQMEDADRAAFAAEMGLGEPAMLRFIRQGQALLGQISFFTVGPDEVRAWPIPRGATAVEAAGVIHSDLARGFIRAEVMAYEDLHALATEAAVKAAGRHRLEGRDYTVRDGDILNIRFNV